MTTSHVGCARPAGLPLFNSTRGRRSFNVERTLRLSTRETSSGVPLSVSSRRSPCDRVIVNAVRHRRSPAAPGCGRDARPRSSTRVSASPQRTRRRRRAASASSDAAATKATPASERRNPALASAARQRTPVSAAVAAAAILARFHDQSRGGGWRTMDRGRRNWAGGRRKRSSSLAGLPRVRQCFGARCQRRCGRRPARVCARSTTRVVAASTAVPAASTPRARARCAP